MYMCPYLVIKTIFNLMASESHGTLVCRGHFNTIINSKSDTSHYKQTATLWTKLFKKDIEEIGLMMFGEIYTHWRRVTYITQPHIWYIHELIIF